MRNRWSIEQAWKFWDDNPWMIECNYVPSLTLDLSIWQEDTIEAILPSVKKELEEMKNIGFNTVRMRFDFDIWFYERNKYFDLLDNTIFDQIPLYYEKKIGSTHWGLVAGYVQFYLPWEWLKDARPELDYSLWQHEILKEEFTPYAEKEIELIKYYTSSAHVYNK